MSRATLEEFSRRHGQNQAAGYLGMSQSSLNKALQLGRVIFVTKHKDGSYTAEELRPFPSQTKKEPRHNHKTSQRELSALS